MDIGLFGHIHNLQKMLYIKWLFYEIGIRIDNLPMQK